MNNFKESDVSKGIFSYGALIRHGFTDYMRDYEVIVGGILMPADGYDYHSYHFVGCREAHIISNVESRTFDASLSDENVSWFDDREKDQPDGFIWGVRSSETEGFEFSELKNGLRKVIFQTEAFCINIKFHELRYTYLGCGDSAYPYTKQYPI